MKMIINYTHICTCFIQTWDYIWVKCILMFFFRKYKWLFLVIKSVIKPWVLNKFSFPLRAHIQWIDSNSWFYSCWKYTFLTTRNKKSIWIKHSQIYMQQLKISFFRLPSKKHFYFEKKKSKGGARSPPPFLPAHYKIIFCPSLPKVPVAPLYLFVHQRLSVCLARYLSICPSTSVRLSACLSICLTVPLSV